jgi:choice-of-anchor A domain-containing protein
MVAHANKPKNFGRMMDMRNLFCSCLMLLCIKVFPLAAQASPLGIAGEYNVFMLDDLSIYSTDIEGRVAVGGDAYFGQAGNNDGFAVASKVSVSNPSLPEVVVGGNLKMENGSVGNNDNQAVNYQKGTIYVGGSTIEIAPTVGKGDVIPGTPIDFIKEGSNLKSMSTFWASISPTGVSTFEKDQQKIGNFLITLTGVDPKLNAFYLDAGLLAKASKFSIDVPFGSTLLVNISGTNASLGDFAFFYDGIQGDYNPNFPDQYILYNFYQATALNITGIKVDGSILAPWADINFTNGHIDGNLIGWRLEGDGEAHLELFNGQIPVPEASTLILLGSGLAGIAALRRRMKL